MWGESDASWALPGDSGRDLLLGAARRVGRPVGGVAARGLSGRAARDGRLGLVGTHHNRHTDDRATRDERDALHFDTRTLLLAWTTGNHRHRPPPPWARQTRRTGPSAAFMPEDCLLTDPSGTAADRRGGRCSTARSPATRRSRGQSHRGWRHRLRLFATFGGRPQYCIGTHETPAFFVCYGLARGPEAAKANRQRQGARGFPRL